MCTCGCSQYLNQDKEVILQRVLEIVRTLKLTEHNAYLYEDGEYICGFLGPKIPLIREGEDVWEVVRMVHSFHENFHSERRSSALKAANDVFNNFPAKGSPKMLLTLWQQLESLHREIPDKMIDSLHDNIMASAIRAMRNVHDNGPRRKAELIERYKLDQD